MSKSLFYKALSIGLTLFASISANAEYNRCENFDWYSIKTVPTWDSGAKFVEVEIELLTEEKLSGWFELSNFSASILCRNELPIPQSLKSMKEHRWIEGGKVNLYKDLSYLRHPGYWLNDSFPEVESAFGFPMLVMAADKDVQTVKVESIKSFTFKAGYFDFFVKDFYFEGNIRIAPVELIQLMKSTKPTAYLHISNPSLLREDFIFSYSWKHGADYMKEMVIDAENSESPFKGVDYRNPVFINNLENKIVLLPIYTADI